MTHHAQRLLRDLRGSLLRLRGDLAAFECELQPHERETCLTSAREFYADLVSLRAEFDEVAFDRKKRTLSVTTEPIELDGVYFGPFEIQLDWSDLTGGHPNNYRVMALDAHPAAPNDSVTHPHVPHRLRHDAQFAGCHLLVVLQIRQEGRKPKGLQRRSPTQQAKTALTHVAQIVSIAGPPFGAALRATLV